MTVRIRYKLFIGISSTSAEENDLGKIQLEAVTDGFGEGGSRKFTLVAGATDVALAMGNVTTAGFIAIRTNSKDSSIDPVTIDIKKNSNLAVPDSIVPMAGAKEGHMLLSTSGLTALYATNGGASDMEITLYLAGD